jgi:hypothetical protein
LIRHLHMQVGAALFAGYLDFAGSIGVSMLGGIRHNHPPSSSLPFPSLSIAHSRQRKAASFIPNQVRNCGVRSALSERPRSPEATALNGTDIQFSESFEIDGREMFAHACKLGLEGVVSTVRGSAYPTGRTNDWVKKTRAQRETLTIAGFALSSGGELMSQLGQSRHSDRAQITSGLPR